MYRAFTDAVTLGYGAITGTRKALIVLSHCAGVGFGTAAVAEPVVIVALGDSLTAGYGLHTQDGFVPQLQAWLDTNATDVTVVLRNAGVSGDTTAGGLSRTDWTLTPDVDAMIVTLGGNDYLRGIDPASSRENLHDILSKAQAADVDVLLVGMRVGGNYGADYQSAFEGMYPDLAALFDAPLYPSFFHALTAAAGSQANIIEFMQDDGIHPNAKGVRKIVSDIGPAVADLARRAEQ